MIAGRNLVTTPNSFHPSASAAPTARNNSRSQANDQQQHVGQMSETAAAIKKLNEEYVSLESQEKSLTAALQKLRQDEHCIQSAINILFDQQHPAKKSKENEEDAMRRLREALLESSSSSDDDGSEDFTFEL